MVLPGLAVLVTALSLLVSLVVPSERLPWGVHKEPVASATTTRSSSERVINTAFVTGYSWFDNTPVGSPAISHPVLHRTAGGKGTYADPITVAVGHSLATGRDVLDYPAGTRFYVPHLRRYVIVEDTCGDGPTPQRLPCHSLTGAPRGTTTWVDVYIGGGPTSSSTAAESCARKITGLRTLIVNPRSDYLTVSGPVLNGKTCTVTYSTKAYRK